MVFVIKIGVFCVFLWICATSAKDVVSFDLDRRGITADELNKIKGEGRNDQDVKESSNKRDYYYLPSSSSSSGYGRPHFSSSGYDSTGISGPSYPSSAEFPPQTHYNRPYDHDLTPQVYPHHQQDHYYPPTGHTTAIAKPNTFALKSILIPIAGLAILGAAAALSTNPVLLQLGVVKGRKRRKRNTENDALFLRKWGHGKRF